MNITADRQSAVTTVSHDDFGCVHISLHHDFCTSTHEADHGKVPFDEHEGAQRIAFEIDDRAIDPEISQGDDPRDALMDDDPRLKPRRSTQASALTIVLKASAEIQTTPLNQ
ncbi:hypothetical protein ABID97_003147 [Variovorax sp. OAS795]|uniref:hypothetical protein n=1 Tax=Variovorax sp. OAS795 TaxID=3034231 RepID=UPI00339A69AF